MKRLALLPLLAVATVAAHARMHDLHGQRFTALLRQVLGRTLPFRVSVEPVGR